MSLLQAARECIANQAAHKGKTAFVALTDSVTLLAKAEQADGRQNGGPLNGKLIGVKDNICTSTLPTTCASGLLRSFASPFEATVVKKIQDAGAIVAGKTNLDEFGMGSHSTHSVFGPVKALGTSEEQALSAGGSSGGSAVAVATGQCWATLGTDTGGSVRLPAAYTGVVGFKPSYGLVSRWGVIAYANSLDTVGILAKRAHDVKMVFDAVNAYDENDPTSLPASTRKVIREVSPQASRKTRLRIGVPRSYNIKELAPEIRKAWVRTLSQLAEVGHSIHSVSLDSTKQALAAYYVLAPAEASSNLAKYDGVRFGNKGDDSRSINRVLFAATRGQGFGDEVKRRILLGAYSLSASAMDNYFIQAQKVRRLVQEDFDRVFASQNPIAKFKNGHSHTGGIDVLICPTAPNFPPLHESLAHQSPVEAYTTDVFTVPASLAGLPAASVPVRSGVQGRGHIGMQVIGQYGYDEVVLEVAGFIESCTALGDVESGVPERQS